MNTHLDAVDTTHAAHGPAAHCPNCAAPTHGKFCAACGESTIVHPPSAGEFLHEFVGHYVALEGKLWSTLKLLMFRPGALTVEFLRGRRVRYVNPLRLYLTLSLIVFALIKLVGVELPKLQIEAWSFGTTYSHAMPDPDGSGKQVEATLVARYVEGDERARHAASTVSFTRQAVEAVGALNPTWAHNLDHFLGQPDATKTDILNHGFLANLPYMLIAALPLFALYLKVLYRGSGRNYGEHLVFGLHANAFAFLLASLMILVPGNALWLLVCLNAGHLRLISGWDVLQLLPLAWLLAYLPLAMRRVYGGGWPATLGRWLVLIGVHLTVIATLVVAAELIGILRHG